MAFTAVMVAPLRHMSHHRPPARISSLPNLVNVALGAVCVCLSQMVIIVFLHSRSWFGGGTGGTYQVSTMCCHQALGHPFWTITADCCLHFYHNA